MSELGFKLNNSLQWSQGTTNNTYVVPDKALTRKVDPKVFKISFGDGYEQRAVNGINNIKEEYTVTFKSRPKVEIDAIMKTLESKNGVLKFDYTYPNSQDNNSKTTIKVVCESFSQTYDYDDFYSCSATFRRVYEA